MEMLNTYHLEVLLCTMVRALYQKKNGRDLFLYTALKARELDVEKVLEGYREHIEFVV